MAREKVGESFSGILLGPDELNELRQRILKYIGTAPESKWVTSYMELVWAIDDVLDLWEYPDR